VSRPDENILPSGAKGKNRPLAQRKFLLVQKRQLTWKSLILRRGFSPEYDDATQ
jgi:hypothetical protein